MFPRTRWLLLLRFIRTGNGSTARRHFICHFVYIENKQHYQCLPAGVKGSLYVDDFCKCFRSKSLIAIERQIQRCLNGIQKWADENGFQFSQSKTVCMHFSPFRSANADPDLKLYGVFIPVVNEFKFLGLIFDNKLTFKQHISYPKDKYFKALNLLRVIARKDWGADCATLLKLYLSHVRSKLDYGCVVYGSARKAVLESLDRVQNAALRTCLGAFRTSPVSSLHVEAGELPFELRRQQLSLQYISKLRSNHSNPTFSCVFGTAFNRLFEAWPHITPTLGIRMHQSVLDSGINPNSIARISTPDIPPWSLKPDSFEFSLHLLGNKSEVTPNVYQSTFNDHCFNMTVATLSELFSKVSSRSLIDYIKLLDFFVRSEWALLTWIFLHRKVFYHLVFALYTCISYPSFLMIQCIFLSI